MAFNLNERSLYKLEGVDSRLVEIVKLAAKLSNEFFIVTEGVRSLERQKELYAAGKSKTMNSYHLKGKAVDLAAWFDMDKDKVVDADELSWKFEHYVEIANAMKEAARQLGYKITWGGDWKSFKDGPHFQIEE